MRYNNVKVPFFLMKQLNLNNIQTRQMYQTHAHIYRCGTMSIPYVLKIIH